MPTQRSYLPSPALIRNLGGLIKLLFALTVLLGLGYFALVALNPKAREWATKGGGPTPFKAVNQILAIPAQAIGKTADVVVANDKRVGQLDGLIAEEEGKAKGGKGPARPVVDPFASPTSPTGKAGSARATAATETADNSPSSISSAAILALAEKHAATNTSPLPAAPRPAIVTAPAPDSPDQMQLAGDILIAQASPAGSPRASAAFFYWVVKLNVGGVTQGKPARVLINNRLIYEGDEVNRTLGIVFAELDPEKKLLIFRDQAGATVTRSY